MPSNFSASSLNVVAQKLPLQSAMFNWIKNHWQFVWLIFCYNFIVRFIPAFKKLLTFTSNRYLKLGNSLSHFSHRYISFAWSTTFFLHPSVGQDLYIAFSVRIKLTQPLIMKVSAPSVSCWHFFIDSWTVVNGAFIAPPPAFDINLQSCSLPVVLYQPRNLWEQKKTLQFRCSEAKISEISGNIDFLLFFMRIYGIQVFSDCHNGFVFIAILFIFTAIKWSKNLRNYMKCRIFFFFFNENLGN